MEDIKIIELFEKRSELAIAQTAAKYGAYLGTVAANILESREDAEECISDCYLKLWNSIPPVKPDNFKLYAAKITRNGAIDRFIRERAQKRGSGSLNACLDELSELVSSNDSVDEGLEEGALRDMINGFLETLPKDQRIMFVKRYYFAEPIKQIASEMDFTESKVKTTLLRTRNSLKELLTREGVEI